MRVSRTLIAPAVAVVLAAGISACGGSSKSSSSGGGSSSASSSTTAAVPLKAGEDPTKEVLTGPTKKKGGTLTVLSNGDFEHLDPGEAYYSLDSQVVNSTNRTLFSYPPNNAETVRPDLASVLPTTSNGGITNGGKTLTIHIRKGVFFSPPVNRMVTSKDVAFALERGANPHVGNAYWPGYFGAQSPAPIVGSTNPKYTGGPLPGITTPNSTTLVIKMTKPGATTMIQALTLGLSAPLPASFVAPLDKHSPTTYGSDYLVSSGPYMVQSNSKGKIQGIGYQPGKSETLVRNPRWNPKTDYRPAYLNRINVNVGGDSTVIGQQVLKGSDSVQLDTVTNSVVKQAYQQYPSQITFTQGSGDHYLNLNNHAGPFKNVNLRRAVFAGLDREAIVKARGGALVSTPMTHFIYPGVAGYQQAGGAKGPQVPWNTDVNGNMTEAHALVKKAGYPSGKYTGTGTVQVVGGSGGNDQTIVQIVNNDLTALGFKTRVSLVDQATMYSKYCGVPKAEIDACPTAGWIRDFADPLSVLLVPFYGPAITSTNNSNWGQVNDPQINAAMVKASHIINPAARDQAWANVDKMLVDQASAVPEEWDSEAQIESKNVAGVNDLSNVGEWDFNYTSLKNP